MEGFPPTAERKLNLPPPYVGGFQAYPRFWYSELWVWNSLKFVFPNNSHILWPLFFWTIFWWFLTNQLVGFGSTPNWSGFRWHVGHFLPPQPFLKFVSSRDSSSDRVLPSRINLACFFSKNLKRLSSQSLWHMPTSLGLWIYSLQSRNPISSQRRLSSSRVSTLLFVFCRLLMCNPASPDLPFRWDFSRHRKVLPTSHRQWNCFQFHRSSVRYFAFYHNIL